MVLGLGRSVAIVDKVRGLGLLAAVAALFALAWRVRTQPLRRMLIASAVAGWIVALFGFVLLLAVESSEVGTTSSVLCVEPGASDSTFFPSRWSWLPPGRVCEFPSGDVGPTYLRIPAAVALVAIPTVPIVAVLRRPLDDEADHDELVDSSA